jgi:hypothetical protein
MSLLSDAMEACTLIDQITQADGYGGFVRDWQDGALIQCAIVLDTSTETRIAEAQGTQAIYTITTDKVINLQYHQVLRRERDGKVFRVTSDGDDNATPVSAMLNMRQVTAEEFDLPRNEW